MTVNPQSAVASIGGGQLEISQLNFRLRLERPDCDFQSHIELSLCRTAVWPVSGAQQADAVWLSAIDFYKAQITGSILVKAGRQQGTSVSKHRAPGLVVCHRSARWLRASPKLARQRYARASIDSMSASLHSVVDGFCRNRTTSCRVHIEFAEARQSASVCFMLILRKLFR